MTKRLATVAFLGLGTLIGVALPPPSADAAPPREAFVSAGWSDVDPATGEDRLRTLIASGQEGKPALIEYGITDLIPTACPKGGEGMLYVEGGGSGHGTLTVGRNLGHATMQGLVDVEVRTYLLGCSGFPEPDVEQQADVSVSISLVGVERRWQESGGGGYASPSHFNVHWRSRADGRDGAGSFAIDDVSYPAEFGDFGFVRSQSHESRVASADPTPFARSTVVLPWLERVSDLTGTEVGSLLRAEGISEQEATDRYQGVYLGVDQILGGETELFFESFGQEAKRCDSGDAATVDTFGSGSGPGRMDRRGHLGDATAAGTVDITYETVDGCTGELTVESATDVPVRLELAAQGPRFSVYEWEARQVPSLQNDRWWSGYRAREASGSITIAGQTTDTTSGQLLWQKWRSR